jgi:hypothetical protein
VLPTTQSTLKATEEWFRQASKVERKVYEQTWTKVKMEMLRLEVAAVVLSDEVFKLKPNALIAGVFGIAKFYLGDLKNAAGYIRNAQLCPALHAGDGRAHMVATPVSSNRMRMDKEETQKSGETGGIGLLVRQRTKPDGRATAVRGPRKQSDLR